MNYLNCYQRNLILFVKNHPQVGESLNIINEIYIASNLY